MKENRNHSIDHSSTVVPVRLVEGKMKIGRFYFWFVSAEEQQGCQMVYFQTKNPNLGKFSTVLH
jgi:hypothetical protein